MNISVKHSMRLLCSTVIVMLVYMAGITAISAYALDNNIYLADAHPHYRHPVTGVIEDSGGDGSEVLGQSMTEGALKTESLIEVDPEGRMYATIRLGLMDNIENPQFKVQKDGYSDFYDVSADLMKENYDANESDFRFEIPNENAIVRCTFYVVAMGRDVVFYMDFDNIREGSGDFVTSVEVKHNDNNDNNGGNEQPDQNNEQPAQTTTAQTTTKPAETTTKATTTTKKAEESSSLADSSSAVTTTTTTVTLPVADSDDTSGVKGLELFDENGDPMEKDSSSEGEKSGDSGKRGNAVVPVAIAAAVVVIAGGAGFVVWKKRRL